MRRRCRRADHSPEVERELLRVAPPGNETMEFGPHTIVR